MKINLFNVMIGGVVIVIGVIAFRVYFGHAPSPSSNALTAVAENNVPNTTSTDTSTAPVVAEIPATVTPTVSAQTTNHATASSPAPTAPNGLSAISTTDSTIVLSWGASYASSGIAGYRISMNKNVAGTTAAQKFEAQKLNASTTYSFTVAAYDQNGIFSPESASINVTTEGVQATTTVSSSSTSTTSLTNSDATPPSTPTNLSATGVSSSEIDLSWNAATDNVGVTGYKIFASGVFIATTSGMTYKSTNLVAGATYSYNVAAYDAAGNTSPQSTSANATTLSSPSSTTPPPDTTPPTTGITSPTTSATVSGTLTVSASASDDVGVIKVELYVDGSLQGNDTSLPYTFSLNTASLSNGTHSLTTKAYDAAGNIGTSSAVSITVNNENNATSTSTSATSTTTTTTPPTPTNLSATAVSSSEIDLSWTVPANSAGITGYQIFRNGHPLAASATTSYHDTGLSAATTFTYAVAAYVTAADNASALSTSTSATTQN
jgi:chitodextrinase